MNKVDNLNSVVATINKFNEMASIISENIYSDILPSVAYCSSKVVGSRLRYENFNHTILYDILKTISNIELLSTSIIINVEDTFIISVNDWCEPAVYIKNPEPICELQHAYKLGKYVVIDEDCIFTNSTLHSLDVYKLCAEFVHLEEITSKEILDFFNTIYNIVLKYVPNMKNLDEIVEKNHQSNKQEYDSDSNINIDLEKYFITCDHTALTTGAWDE